MSHFLKNMFRSSRKHCDKENEPSTDEDKVVTFRRDVNGQGSTRRDKRSLRMSSIDDTFLRPSAPYHTITQPKQSKGARSCIGRDEYERHRPSFDASVLRERNYQKYNKRILYGSGKNEQRTSKNMSTFDAELIDSDDSFSSDRERRSRTIRNDELLRALDKMDYLRYQFEKMEEKKDSYKQKLLVAKHVETKFVQEIQGLKVLIKTLKEERNMYRDRIAFLEAQLKESKLQTTMQPSFTAGSLFCSPPSTSNDQSSVGGAGEMLCVTSDSTLPLKSAFHCNSFNDECSDEVKNFRTSEIHSTIELARSECPLPIVNSDEKQLDTTILDDSSSSDSERCLIKNPTCPHPRSQKRLRRSLSDTNITGYGREARLKMTNL